MFDEIYRNKKVFLTGHSGFKGSWLSLFLHTLGAEVYGYSLVPNTTPNHYTLLDSNIFVNSKFGDINDYVSLESALQEVEPEIIFHLAAQPLVRYSYQEPLYTFQTNAIGTLNLLDSARKLKNLSAIVIITTDKVYENKEWLYGYREYDRLGGHDPYSASKACAEIIIDSMRKSFFDPESYRKTHSVLIATARAGNVIGGGDWSEDRLIPDLIRGVADNNRTRIRNPNTTRPWQHVLEPLHGYLMLGQKLLKGQKEFATSFNFGPNLEGNVSVQEVLEIAQSKWNKIQYEIHKDSNAPHETNLLMLDSTKAQKMLGWNPVWNHIDAIMYTMQWYKEFYENNQVISTIQLQKYKESL
ncbi:CDP-glucose 4,6-dehydratase [Helicobacter labetoulli]|uniref:CDP-glucose 4,6-dehydratase n=1 Tax=Helicobacter labetoulli TaxID=2315333 RepID=UPI000EF70623|nr:CDP-glucose 4,6-dehydratase [Helicobacter labetoulli]